VSLRNNNEAVSLRKLLKVVGETMAASASSALQAVQSLDVFSGMTGVLGSRGAGRGADDLLRRRRVKIYVEGKLVAGLDNDAVLDVCGMCLAREKHVISM
jgi:hypothetical protein